MRHTIEQIATKKIDVCTEWSITKQNIITVVTDGTANMMKAIDWKNQHFRCFAHTLNLDKQN